MKKYDRVGIEVIPPTVICSVVGYLTVLESRALVMTCSQLWQSRCQTETKRNIITIESLDCLHVCQSLSQHSLLVQLDIGSLATNDSLFALDSWSERFPRLCELSMEGSSVANLRVLHGHPTLRYLDITYCNGISYQSAIECRESLPTLGAIVRRLPTWMVGRIQTGFENDGIHTYWPDGTFSFDREESCTGFVDSIRKLDGDRVVSRVRYCEGTRQVAPSTAEVTILPLRHEQKQILVAQSFTGHSITETVWPTSEQARFPVGKSRFVDSTVMVTKMNVFELTEPSPPNDIREVIRRSL